MLSGLRSDVRFGQKQYHAKAHMVPTVTYGIVVSNGHRWSCVHLLFIYFFCSMGGGMHFRPCVHLETKNLPDTSHSEMVARALLANKSTKARMFRNAPNAGRHGLIGTRKLAPPPPLEPLSLPEKQKKQIGKL